MWFILLLCGHVHDQKVYEVDVLEINTYNIDTESPLSQYICWRYYYDTKFTQGYYTGYVPVHYKIIRDLRSEETNKILKRQPKSNYLDQERINAINDINLVKWPTYNHTIKKWVIEIDKQVIHAKIFIFSMSFLDIEIAYSKIFDNYQKPKL